MLDIFFAILPVFLVIFFGMIADRLQLLPSMTASILGAYVLRMALPILLLRIMANADPLQLLRGGFCLGLFLSQALVYFLGYAAERFFTCRPALYGVTTALSCSSYVAAFVGLPIVQSLLPGNNEALLIAGLVAIMPTLSMAGAQMHYEVLHAKENPESGNRRHPAFLVGRALLLNPLVLGLAAGALLSMTSLGLWAPLDRAAELVGMTAAPAILLALGLDMCAKLGIARAQGGKGQSLRQLGITVIKLIVHPLLTWIALLCCGVDGLWLGVSVLMAASGTAAGTYVIAELYKAVPEETALSVVITNALSLLSMSAFAYVLTTQGFL